MSGIEVLIIVAVLALAAAYALAQAKPKGGFNKQDQPTTLATRGDRVPHIIGTDKNGYLAAWAGDRRSEEHGGGGKGGGGGAETTTWFENGWHACCLGVADILEGIKDDGKFIWHGPITRQSTPSGTSINVPDHGTFTIYWGEPDQPINEFLADPNRVGIRSRWPYLCYVQWNDAALGPSPQWPQREYIIGCVCVGTTLQDSAMFLDNGSTNGVNAAHAIVLFAGPYPHGCGLGQSAVDNDTLELLGVLMESEHLPVNMSFTDGDTFEKAFQNFMDDLGFFIPYAQGRLAFMPIRESLDPIPVLDDDVVMPPDFGRTIDRGYDPMIRTVFAYRSKFNFNFRERDMAWQDDGEAGTELTVTDDRVLIPTATHAADAAKIARRKIQMNSIYGGFSVDALRGARKLIAGQQFARVGVGTLRVINRLPSDQSAKVVLECVLDSYGVPDIDDQPNEPTGGPGSTPLPVAADIAFTWFELGPEVLLDKPAIIVLRTRAHQQISGARIYVSGNDINFTFANNQNYPSAGGIISNLQDLATSIEDVIIFGPIFEDENGDASTILDLSNDESSWKSGRQIATINREIGFLQSVSVVAETVWAPLTAYAVGNDRIPSGTPTGLRYRCTTAGNSGATAPPWPTITGQTVNDGTCVWTARRFRYQMNNWIRARAHSVPGVHAIGDRIFIADRTKLTIITNPIIEGRVGELLYVKSVPQANGAFADISSIASVSFTLTGLAIVTYPLRVTSDGKIRITSLGELRIVKL